MAAVTLRRMSFWLFLASGAVLLAGLACAQSVSLRGFWPDFSVALSVGMLFTALLRSAA